MDRKEFLRSLGLLTVGSTVLGPEMGAVNSLAGSVSSSSAEANTERLDYPIRGLKAKVDKPITIVILGAGGRGTMYAHYAKMFPDVMKVIGFAEPIEVRRNFMIKEYGIPKENAYYDYRDALAVSKFADAVVISTPDDLHYDPCMKALALGYNVLLEKPVAPTEKECMDILAQSKKYGGIVAVCHVLRYAPYFLALKNALKDNLIGKVISIQHMEPIQYGHMAHSYVRGNWRSSKQTTPIILAKSCHDLDIIRWLLDEKCKTISADGSLSLFKAENAPEGATLRCTDGCPHESTCPYSAIDIYVRRKEHTRVFDLKDPNDNDEIMEKLRTNEYGRCVFHCDNDQPDHYVTNMVFEDGATASFSMEAFTPWGGRRTRIMGTKGYIEGDMKTFTVYDFRSSKKYLWEMRVQDAEGYKNAGHGGGDYALLRDFLEAVDKHDASALSSTIDASIESHVMGFRAEKSRLSNKKVKI